MTDLDRDPTQAMPLTVAHWLTLCLALVLGAVFGGLLFGIR